MKHSLTALLLFSLVGAVRAETPEQVFERRIVPIFKSPNPSSCVQCHLAGVDLKDYILPSSRDTFLSLRDQKLIDLDSIEKSKILALIQMGQGEKPKETAVHQANRAKEYEAFVAWLKVCAADPALRGAPALKPDARARPARPVEVIRHERKDRLLASFENTVWAMRFRCMNCHTEGSPANQKHVAKWGERVTWIKKGGAEETLDYLLASKLIDRKAPEKSLLLTKALNEVKHEGGKKFEVGDQAYKAMRSFLEDAVKTLGNEYQTAASLPKGPSVLVFGSQHWIKLTGTPATWAGKVAHLNVHAWNEKTKGWEDEPIASTDRRVSPTGNLFQHSLTLLATPDSDRAKQWKSGKPALERGKYLIKIWVDRDDLLAKNWQAALGDEHYAGATEISTEWKEGYASMTVVEAGRFKR